MESIPYLEWMKDKLDKVEYDLARTGLRYYNSQGNLVSKSVKNENTSKNELKQILSQEYDLRPENFLITTGATFANYLVTLSLKDKVNKFLVEKPAYQPLYYTPQLLGIKIDRIKREIEKDFKIDLEDLKSKLKEPSLVVLTNRHNPSGKLIGHKKLKQISEIIAQNDSYLLVDEVYSPYNIDDDSNNTAFGGPTAINFENTIVTNSLTKFFGMGGLKIGWMGGDEEIIYKCDRLQTHFSPVAEPSKNIAKRVLEKKDKIQKEANELLEKNFSLLKNLVVKRNDLEGRVYKNNTFAFLKHKTIDGSELAKKTLKNNTIIVPGEFFDDEKRFRISIAEKTEKAQSSINIFEEILDNLN